MSDWLKLLLLDSGIDVVLRAIDAGMAALILVLALRLPWLRQKLPTHLVHALLWVGLLHFVLPRPPGAWVAAWPSAFDGGSVTELARWSGVPLSVEFLIGVAILHGLGVLVVLAAIARQELRVRHWLHDRIDVPEAIGSRFAATARGMGFARAPELILSREVPVPMAVGLGQARVLIPAAAANVLDQAQLEDVFAHELAHLRRRDPIFNAIRVGICALWWWHPVVWWLSREIQDSREESCDDFVLAQLRVDSNHYARTLLTMAESTLRPRTQWLASGVSGGRAHPLVSRVRRLSTIRRPTLANPGWGWAIACALLAAFWTTLPLEAARQRNEAGDTLIYLHAHSGHAHGGHLPNHHGHRH